MAGDALLHELRKTFIWNIKYIKAILQGVFDTKLHNVARGAVASCSFYITTGCRDVDCVACSLCGVLVIYGCDVMTFGVIRLAFCSGCCRMFQRPLKYHFKDMSVKLSTREA